MVLRHGVPLTSGGALVDDYLYVRIAGYLAHGQWLGPFDQYTLLKGPAYPAFIAAMCLTPLATCGAAEIKVLDGNALTIAMKELAADFAKGFPPNLKCQ